MRAVRQWWMRVEGGSLPLSYLAWELASADLCPATASKPPSLRWRLGKLTDVCCKYVHCNAGTQTGTTSPYLWTMCGPGEREGPGWVDLGIFWQLLPDRYLTSHASHITRKETFAEYGLGFREWKQWQTQSHLNCANNANWRKSIQNDGSHAVVNTNCNVFLQGAKMIAAGSINLLGLHQWSI